MDNSDGRNPTRDALMGLTALDQSLVLLDYGNVIVRNDYKTMKTVRLISGGCAGDNLNYAFLVGKGLLTAAILGERAVAPCSRLILRTIRELTWSNKGGVLVIAPYNSALFNFGLAVERAKNDCLRAQMLIADAYVVDLIVKVAGAMAEIGASCDEICHICNGINQELAILDPEEAPEEPVPKCSNVQKLGDPGVEILNLAPLSRVVVIVNHHCKSTRIEVLNIVKGTIDRLKAREIFVQRLYCGTFLPSIDSNTTVLVLKKFPPKVIEYLDFPCSAPGWQHWNQFLPQLTTENETSSLLTKQAKPTLLSKGPKLTPNGDNIFRTSLRFACDALISCEKQLNLIDAERSVGNIGTRFRRTCECINRRLQHQWVFLQYPYNLLKSLGVVIEGGLGGTIGTIYGIFFEAAAEVFLKHPPNSDVTPEMWLEALKLGHRAVKNSCSEDVYPYSMCVPLGSCDLVVGGVFGDNPDPVQCFGLGVVAAEESAQKTRQAGWKFPDPGAHAIGIWMRALFEGIKLTTPPVYDPYCSS